MRFTRRGFIAGLAVAGAAVPAVLYARRAPDYDDTLEAGQYLTPDEATVEAATA
ncbi:twin-arginine translocation signal domain-containing protein, partial [Pseudomonas sp.]|uniref:twin-arginine translocation signal domain-containing protein n=1 Tax=Pseudomonas sp. TaxID=306 RepID=UPI0034E07067